MINERGRNRLSLLVDWWELLALLSICQLQSDSLTDSPLYTLWQVLLNMSVVMKAGISKYRWYPRFVSKSIWQFCYTLHSPGLSLSFWVWPKLVPTSFCHISRDGKPWLEWITLKWTAIVKPMGTTQSSGCWTHVLCVIYIIVISVIQFGGCLKCYAN